MYSLNRLVTDDVHNYLKFASHRKPETQGILMGVLDLVAEAYDSYESAVNASRFEPIALTASEREALRTNFGLMSRSRPMSYLRDELFALTAEGRCAYCDTGQVSTLDHYLPKSEYQEYSVLTLNLIPACFRCNHARGTALLGEDESRMWHAFVDAVPSEQFLFADVTVRLDAPSVAYFVRLVDGAVDAELFSSLAFAFERLELAYHFMMEAAGALVDISHTVSQVAASSDREGLSKYLRGLAADHVIVRGANHWRSALYSALIDNDEFLSWVVARADDVQLG